MAAGIGLPKSRWEQRWGKIATSAKGDRSALKELENRRGRGKSEAGKESGPGSASDWEIIEIRDRKIR